MQTDFIDQIEPTPKLATIKCKIVAFLLRIFFQFTGFISGVIFWYIYDYFIGIATFLLSFLVVGIIKSKLRNSVIPKRQQEYNYTDQGIAEWYTARAICFEQNADEISPY